VENNSNLFAANLFEKLCAKFYHNRQCFVGDITKNILVSFFLDIVHKKDKKIDKNQG